ncbi:aldehyde dehydrogenase family protein [Pseudarthrobacter raffinosi]|uniref:aldehyde dehydrogenase family protein n=1 Tax=Pseudarthrobacter raffinosi TaxID=2953651 RepID=UPI00208FCDD0|nr:aldehyde dehydrogenase family protein [Pseudarthrobacter sp. MDT3-9]MCO4252130.1 aldehyde dehydrogenase family protein [Pseudarthrobacter sp. MDT3-9]
MNTPINHDDLFIDGEFVEAASKDRFTAINPATEEVLGTVPISNAEDIDRAVRGARTAFSTWSQTTGAERAEVLSRLADAFAARGDDIAALVSRQNGAPQWWVNQNKRITEAIYRNGAKNAAAILAEEVLPGGEHGTVVRKEPLGVVAAIVPWNSPQALLSMKIAASLAAGCTVVVKPSPETSLDIYLLAEAIREAKVPPGVINIVTGAAETGANLVAHPGIDKVSFTGSTAAGRAIAISCAENLKPLTAELGGKSAAVLLEDADIEVFTDSIPWRCLPFSGQVCHAITRVIVPRSRHQEVLDAMVEKLSSLSYGDTSDPDNLLGPLATAAQRDRVEEYIKLGVQEGARLVLGGGRPKGFDSGYYIEPTIFTDTDPSMRIFTEEIFGPVLCVAVYDTEDEAAALHDATNFGLSGSVFSRDIEHATEFARRLGTGEVLINGKHGAPNVDLVRSFYKHSSLGGGMDLVSRYQLTKSIPRA